MGRRFLKINWKIGGAIIGSNDFPEFETTANSGQAQFGHFGKLEHLHTLVHRGKLKDLVHQSRTDACPQNVIGHTFCPAFVRGTNDFI